MFHAEPQCDFRVAANELYSAVEKIVLSGLLNDLTPSGKQSVRDPLSLVASLMSKYGPYGDEFEAVLVRRNALVSRGRRLASSASHPDGVLTCLFNADVSPVTRHIGHMVRARIVDLIQQLLSCCRGRHESICTRRFRQNEFSRGLDLHNRKSDVHPTLDVLPVSEQSTSPLRSALDEMSSKGSLREFVQIARAPPEFVDQRSEYERGVHHSACDDDLASVRKSLRNREGAEVRVAAHGPRRKRCATEHLRDLGVPELVRALSQVVSQNGSNFHVHFRCRGRLQKGLAAGLHIDTARIHNHFDLFGQDRWQQLAHGLDKISCKTCLGFSHLLRRHDGHRNLSEIIAHQVMNLTAIQQLRSAQGRVTPHRAIATDANWLAGHLGDFACEATNRA
mmetsp:Transcript_52070/g.138770  ORF Transcript_52070/g.138770 Transcript_52070/m.138770 type:complete len:393 (-) Transcript_52070:9-1187(-)